MTTVTDSPNERNSKQVLSTRGAMILFNQIRTQRLSNTQRIENIKSFQHSAVKIGLEFLLDIILVKAVAPDINSKQRADLIQVALQRSPGNLYGYIQKWLVNKLMASSV